MKNSEVFRNLVEGSPDSIVAVDLGGNITYCNRATEILTGYRKKELIGKHFSQLASMGKKEIHFSVKLFKALRSGKKVVPFEMQARHKNGKLYWIEVHLSRVKANGKVIGFQVNTRNVTERKKMQEALIRKEKLATERAHLLNDLRSLNRIDDILARVCQAIRESGLFERAVMTLHQPEGRIIYLGQVGLPRNVIERARQALPIDHKLRSRITSPEFRISDSFFIPVEAGLDYTKTKRYVLQKKKGRAEGDWRLGDELFVPLRDFLGEVMGYLSVDTPSDGCRPDVKTVQALEMLVEAAAARIREVQIHQGLSESEEKFRTLAEQSPNIIFINKKGRVMYANKKCEEIMGYKREEFYSPDFDFLTLIAPEFRESIETSFAKHTMGKEVDPVEYALITKNGKRIEAILSTKVMRYRGENAILGIITDITERKQAEGALQRSEERFRLIAETSLDYIFQTLKNGKTIYCSPSIERVLGYTPKERQEKDFISIILPSDLPKARALFKKAIEGEAVQNIEINLLHKNGKIVPIEVSVVPISENKEVTSLLGIARDITERKRAEKKLRQSEETARALLNAPSDVALLLEPDGTILALNEAAAKTLGKSPDELIGSCVYDLFPPDVVKYRKAQANKVFRSGKPIRFEDERRGRLYDQNAYPVFNPQGKVVGLAIFVRDITEHKRAEEALQASENKYKTLLENLPQKIFLKDKNSVYLSCNENFAQDLKIKAEEFAGKTDYDFFPKELAEKYRADDKKIMRLGKTEDIEEKYIQNGREVFVHTVKTPVKDEHGNLIGLLGIFWDITERKRVEEALRIERDRLETVTQNAAVGLAIISKDYRTLWANKVLKQIFGEVEGKICYSTYHQWNEICPGCGVREIFEMGRHKVVHEQVGKGTSGKTIWAQIVATPIKDEEGNITAALEVVVDITERKRMEEVLRENEARYRSLFEDSPISLWEEDFSRVKRFIDSLRAKGVKDFRKYFENHPEAVAKCATMVKVIDVNNASLKLFKAKSKEALQRGLENTFSEESYDAFREELLVIARGEKTFETEALTQTLKGDKKHVFVMWSVAPGYEKALSKVMVSISDITELKRAREQNLLLETSKAVSQTLKLEQVLKIGTEKMAKALKADRCAVAFTDQNIDFLTMKHLYLKDGSPSSTRLRYKISTSEFSEVIKFLKGKGYYQIFNTRTDPLPGAARKYLLRAGVKSCLVIPMSIGKRLLGLFNIGSVEKLRNFTKEEIGLAQTIANQVAVATENTLLVEDLKKKHSQITEQSRVLQRQYQEQSTLMKISRELSQTLDQAQILEIATKEAAQALGVDRCVVALAFPEEGYAEIKSIYVKQGKPVTHRLGFKLYPDHFPQAKEMFEKRKSIQIPNIYHLPGKSFAKKYFTKEGIKSALFAPMVHGKKLVGFFTLSTMKDFKTFTKEEIKLAQTIADQVAVAIENARLLELLKKNEGNLRRLNAQLINIQEDERKKLAQKLHDEIGQSLFAMKMSLDMTKKTLPINLEDLGIMKSRLSDTENLLSQTIDQIRNLTTDLRPSMLDDFGLIPALKWYIENFSKRTNVKVYLKTKDLKPRLSSEVETTLYRILQEALTNVAKHAHATEVSILLKRENHFASLLVQDNGIGFETEKVIPAKDKFGLFSIKERVELLGGRFEIRSKPNKGTKLNVKIPLIEEEV